MYRPIVRAVTGFRHRPVGSNKIGTDLFSTPIFRNMQKIDLSLFTKFIIRTGNKGIEQHHLLSPILQLWHSALRFVSWQRR